MIADWLRQAITREPRPDLLAVNLRSLESPIVAAGTIESALKVMHGNRAVEAGRMTAVWFDTVWIAALDIRVPPERGTMPQERTEPEATNVSA